MAPPRENETEPTAPLPPIICSGSVRQRDPAIFSGTDEQDVEDWLGSYERVSTYNNWDDRVKLNNVIFYLTGVANLWYRNHEGDIGTWSAFKTSFSEIFGRPAVRKLRAEQRLRERAQQAGENFTSYIEDVVDLCKRVNAAMTEEEKIKHILKGITDDAFQMLLAKNPQTVADVITICQSYDELRKQRAVTRRSCAQDESLSSLATAGDDTTLLPRIQQFIREEVARQLSLVPYAPMPPSTLDAAIKGVIQQQVADALPCSNQRPTVAARLTNADIAQPTTVAAPLTYVDSAQHMTIPGPLTYAAAVARPYADVVSRPTFADVMPRPYAEPAARSQYRSVPHVPHVPQVPASAPTASSSMRQSRPWRTPDNRPICFSCGIPGHVARYCRRSMMTTRQPYVDRPYGSPQPLDRAPDRFPMTTIPADHRDSASRRSPSPRRRSLSPMRRRPVNTEAEN